MDRELLENGSGCVDPTAYEAISKVDKERRNIVYNDVTVHEGNISETVELLNSKSDNRRNTYIPKDRVRKFYMLLDTIRDVCELSGFSIEEHIILKDKVTGKIWR